MTKLKYSGIFDYFDPNFIYIHRRKIDPDILNSLPKNSIIVDDRLEIITDLTPYSHLNPVWLNRKDNVISQPVRTIHSLVELV